MGDTIKIPLPIKDGDIFHWRFSDEKLHADYLNYWCKSRIFVCRGDRLVDTYWGGGDNFSAKLDDISRFNLEYIGNFSELEKRESYESEYYDSKDIVNLNHSNSSNGNFYIRKGAKRSKDKILEVLSYKKEQHERDAEYANRRAKEIDEQIKSIKSGELDIDKVYI